MPATIVPESLRERLGHDGTLGLHQLLAAEREDWSEDVLATATDRFECRLTSEVSNLRLEMREGLAAVRQEIAAMRFDVVKWLFTFWVGHLVATAGLISMMTRNLRP